MDGGGRGYVSICTFSGVGRRLGLTIVAARGDIDLYQRRLRSASGAGVGCPTQRAASGHLTNSRLSPTLTLDRDAGRGAKVVLEFVAVAAVVCRRASI